MEEKLRRRRNDGDLSSEDKTPGGNRLLNEGENQPAGNSSLSSQELEYLEVKHVVVLLLMVFSLFFIGTFLFLNAINSSDAHRDELQPTPRVTTSETFDEHRGPGTRNSQGNQNSNSPQVTEPKELDLPTILWWTDLLYPHLVSGAHEIKLTCDVGTCYSTKRREYLAAKNTRGIMFYGTDFRAYEAPLPRRPWHEWALLHEESPMNNYILSHGVLLKLFNHTSTFRRESHFPITTQSLPSLAYLTERQPVPLSTKNKLREESLAPVAYIQSHCNVASDRDRYVQELMKHIRVDSYGACLNNKRLPPHLRDPVESMFDGEFFDFISKYKFHLAFENAVCDDYITEKFFRPFHLGSVPVHMGSSTAGDWAPDDHSLISAEDFESPKHLAEFIKSLDYDDGEYERYLEFKKSGVTNRLLVDTVDRRSWATDDHDRHSFITAFECHLCDKIYERWDAEQRQLLDPSVEVPPPRTGEYKHMGCPEPFVSAGSVDDTKLEDDIHSWVHDYWSMYDQALALQKMIQEGYNDTTQLFDVLHEMYREKGMV